MKPIKFTLSLLLIAMAGIVFAPQEVVAQGIQDQVIPGIVKQCKDLGTADTDAITVRFNALDKDKKALLNSLVYEAYGRFNLPYEKTHLELLLKAVEGFSALKTREHLEYMKKATGQ